MDLYYQDYKGFTYIKIQNVRAAIDKRLRIKRN